MARISYAMAENIAKQEQVKKFDKIISETEHELLKHLYDRVLEEFPVPHFIKLAFGREPEWFRVSSEVYCKLKEESGYRSSRGENWTMPNSHIISMHGRFKLEPNETTWEIYNRWEDLKKQSQKFKSDLENLMCGLGTPKRIVESVPELSHYFENQLAKNHALVPLELIKNIRSQLVKG